MQKIANLLDGFCRLTGKLFSWFLVILILEIAVNVTLRYTLNITSVLSYELEWHLFASVFLLATGWALTEDRHVRVDVFYQKFKPKTQAWINIIGTTVLLIPFCLVAISESLSFVISSYQINESSPDPGGLPFRWIIKSTIPLGFFFLLMAGISQLIQQGQIIISKTEGGRQ